MKATRLSLIVPALVLAGFAVVLVLSDGAPRGVAGPNDARILFADSLFTWSAATRADSLYTWSAATNVIPEVNGQAAWDPETSSWTYTYTVKNDISSPNAIMTFALAPVLEPQSIVAPTHWYQTYGFQERPDAAVWAVVDRGPPPVEDDSVSVYPSPFDIQPGDSVSSFSIVSSHGPGWITYFVQGYYDLPPYSAKTPIDGCELGSVRHWQTILWCWGQTGMHLMALLVSSHDPVGSWMSGTQQLGARLPPMP